MLIMALSLKSVKSQPSKARKRLTGPNFLDRYRKFLKEDGVVNLKDRRGLILIVPFKSFEIHVL